MSEGAFYSWKSKSGGMMVSDTKRLKAFKDENAKLKELLAEQMLNAAEMKELLAKNGGTRRQARGCCASVGQVRSVVAVACRIAGADRKMVRYQSRCPPDTALRTCLRDLANERRRFVPAPVHPAAA